jgi:hypothetical protein
VAVTTGDTFELMSVIHLVRPVGEQAGDLEALRAGIARADTATLFYHTLQCPLRMPDTEEPKDDDLSTWVRGVVQDSETAERLAFAVQAHGGSPTDLRGALLEVLESVPEPVRVARDAPPEAAFAFLMSESVPVPTGTVARDADELMDGLETSDLSAWFYHLYEQPWFEGGTPLLTRWLAEHGERRFAEAFDEEARSGRGLAILRRRVLRRWRQNRLRSRIAAASGHTENERREHGRAAVAGLVRRMTRGEDTDARHGS